MNLEEIGNRIKFLRLNYTNCSQDEFATKMGFDRSYMSRVESGKQNITVGTLIKICEEGLEISLKDFFDFDNVDIVRIGVNN